MRRTIVVSAVCVMLASCETTGNSSVSNIAIRRTAATEALGKGANPLPLIKANSVMPGRIYKDLGNGRYAEICEKDFENHALKVLGQASESYPNQQVADRVYQSNATIVGITARLPYERIAVSGYTIRSIDYDGDLSSYILANIGDKCRNVTLPANEPYFIASEVAVADSVSIYGREAIDSIGIPGWISVQISDGEELLGSKRNVAFGYKGVPKAKK